MRSTLLLVFSLLGTVICVSYEGYKVYKIIAKTDFDNQFLQALEQNKDFDFWSEINRVGKPVDVMVSPDIQTKIEANLKKYNISYTIKIENVQSIIEAEKNYHKVRKPLKNGKITFDQYLRHDEMNAYLAQIASTYPDVVTLETIGQSYEKRDMNLVRISSGPRDPPKPIIFVDAGIHAREWIAPAMALYLINQLVENPENSNLIQDVDWIILPCHNPDGYEYTWTGNRVWKKTRSPNVDCIGTDANLNFDFHWMESGASDHECDSTYAGKEAFSEVENRNFKDYLMKTENIKAYIPLHSYGSYLLYPFSYGNNVPCDNWQELDELAHRISDAVHAFSGTDFHIGNAAQLLYTAAGTSDDWVMGVAGIKIVLKFKLPGEGYDLPPAQIEPVCSETFQGFKVLADYVGNL